jgi:hypothetical protein
MVRKARRQGVIALAGKKKRDPKSRAITTKGGCMKRKIAMQYTEYYNKLIFIKAR